jgi:hypothetical protein
MKKFILFVMMCIPAALMAQNGNGVTVSGLVVTAGTATFNVSWQSVGMPTLWSDTVWVWVDYNNAGMMERLPLSAGATLTETSAPGVGKVVPVDGNTQGVWVVGNARSAGSFSATVKLHTATADLAGACAYASNYLPVGEYSSSDATEIVFTGTPMYTIVLKDNGGSTITRQSGSPFSVPASYTVQSFTDKTGAPGTIKCIPMTGNIDFTVPASISKGLVASFAATTSGFTTPPAAALTYTWSAPGFSPDTHTGATYTPTAPVTTGSYPVTLTAPSEGYCDLERSKTVTVIDCIPSTVYDLEVSASGFCEGGTGVTFALSGTEYGRSYELYKGAEIVATLEGTGSATPFNGAMTEGNYTAQVLASNGYCEATMSGTSVTIYRNPLPTVPVIAKPDDVCLNGGNLVFTATGYSGLLTWISNGGGSESGDGVTFNSSATGTKTVTARSAQTHTNAPTCYSAEVTQSASVQALPTPTIAASASTVCLGTNITFRVTQPVSGATYTWSGAAGTASGSGDGTYTVNGVTTGTKSVTAYARLALSGTTCQSDYASRTAVVSQPGNNGQAADVTCGCATGTTNCSGICTTNGTYTKNDGACTGACQRAYVSQHDQCGTVIAAQYSTYTEPACRTGCVPLNSGDCWSNGQKWAVNLPTDCEKMCFALAKAKDATHYTIYYAGSDACFCYYCF